MDTFPGFSPRSRQTPVPNLFFTAVLPLIDDLAELKVSLHLFYRLAWKRSYPRYLTAAELAADLDLMSGLALEGKDPAQELTRGLGLAVARGAFLRLELERDGPTPRAADVLYFTNTDADRQAIARIQQGQIDLGALPKMEPVTLPPERRNIYALYEANIGLLTPLLADKLKEAEQDYPPAWIEDAFGEAVRLNKRSWAYIQRILENWKTQGKHGTPGRHTEEVPDSGAGNRGGYLVKRRKP
ncbi:MAG: DnaD domain protein [Dehalococcoidia bacterium]|nr:DnaD domain protein [Dehalococcoidia bacterium]